jgi:hypothetical protein
VASQALPTASLGACLLKVEFLWMILARVFTFESQIVSLLL